MTSLSLSVVQAHRIYSTLRFLTLALWEWILFSVLATGFHDNEGVMGGQSLYENSTFSKPADIEQTNLSLLDVDLKLKAFLKVSN